MSRPYHTNDLGQTVALDDNGKWRVYNPVTDKFGPFAKAPSSPPTIDLTANRHPNSPPPNNAATGGPEMKKFLKVLKDLSKTIGIIVVAVIVLLAIVAFANDWGGVRTSWFGPKTTPVAEVPTRPLPADNGGQVAYLPNQLDVLLQLAKSGKLTADGLKVVADSGLITADGLKKLSDVVDTLGKQQIRLSDDVAGLKSQPSMSRQDLVALKKAVDDLLTAAQAASEAAKKLDDQPATVGPTSEASPPPATPAPAQQADAAPPAPVVPPPPPQIPATADNTAPPATLPPNPHVGEGCGEGIVGDDGACYSSYQLALEYSACSDSRCQAAWSARTVPTSGSDTTTSFGDGAPMTNEKLQELVGLLVEQNLEHIGLSSNDP